MKEHLILVFIAVFCGAIFSTTIKAQDIVLKTQKELLAEKDSAYMMKFSLYSEQYKNNKKKPGVAYANWVNVFKYYPKSHKNVYIQGEKILADLIKNEKDKARKRILVDTLMLVYDQRIKHFGQEGFVLGIKGKAYLRYKKVFEDKNEAIKLANIALMRSVELKKEKADASFIDSYMQSTCKLYKLKQKDAGTVIEVYISLKELLNNKLKTTKKEKKKKKINKTLGNVEHYFVKTKISNCDTLIAVFKPKFEADTTNIDMLRTITKFLGEKCDKSELYEKAATLLYKKEPSALAAYNLAKLLLVKKKYKEVGKYYDEAIKRETDSMTISKYYYEYAAITATKLKNSSGARNHARMALKYRPNWGKPYILIGDLYAASSGRCGGEGDAGEVKFRKKTVYWAAVDKYNTAKSVDASVAAEANKKISQCTGHYPNVEDAFFVGVKDGNSYTVGCWINETTKARF